ncbi:peroxisome assembly protein 12 isoform X1 [Petromyzon marinus]|uniref:peroxisome assembly protein 12 isoform X1 n=1 Tax=Petromyzon marinus TaxID=7757 RepID=UPI003F6FA2B5
MAERGAHLASSATALDGAPSVFEALAQDGLVSAVRPALGHACKVLAESSPALFGQAWRRFDELYLLLDFLLQRHSLLRHSASFSENFYDLKRVPERPGTPAGSRLPRREFFLSLALLVAAPYLRRKVEQMVARIREEMDCGIHLPDSRSVKLYRAFLATYPFVHMTWEGVCLWHQLSYALGRGRHHSPLLRFAGVRLVCRLPLDGAGPEEGPRVLPRHHGSAVSSGCWGRWRRTPPSTSRPHSPSPSSSCSSSRVSTRSATWGRVSWAAAAAAAHRRSCCPTCRRHRRPFTCTQMRSWGMGRPCRPACVPCADGAAPTTRRWRRQAWCCATRARTATCASVAAVPSRATRPGRSTSCASTRPSTRAAVAADPRAHAAPTASSRARESRRSPTAVPAPPPRHSPALRGAGPVFPAAALPAAALLPKLPAAPCPRAAPLPSRVLSARVRRLRVATAPGFQNGRRRWTRSCVGVRGQRRPGYLQIYIFTGRRDKAGEC